MYLRKEIITRTTLQYLLTKNLNILNFESYSGFIWEQIEDKVSKLWARYVHEKLHAKNRDLVDQWRNGTETNKIEACTGINENLEYKYFKNLEEIFDLSKSLNCESRKKLSKRNYF